MLIERGSEFVWYADRLHIRKHLLGFKSLVMNQERCGGKLPQAKEILEIDGLHFTVKLYEKWLRIDVKGNTRNNIVEALENKPLLRQSIGNILDVFVPLHIHLSDIDSVQMDSDGKVKLVLPRHRDVSIPLAAKEATNLVDTMKPLIAREKEREARRVMEERRRAVIRLTIGTLGGLVVGLLLGIFINVAR